MLRASGFRCGVSGVSGAGFRGSGFQVWCLGFIVYTLPLKQVPILYYVGTSRETVSTM